MLLYCLKVAWRIKNLENIYRVTSEKNSALLRNAEISQQMEIAKQETRRQEIEMTELANKITLLEEENKKYKERENKNVEQELKNSIAHLEEQLVEKNKVRNICEDRSLVLLIVIFWKMNILN